VRGRACFSAANRKPPYDQATISDREYVRTRLRRAVEAIDRPGPTHERLRQAWLEMHGIRPAQFDADRPRILFSSLKDRLNALPEISEEGTTAATTKRMSDDQIDRARNAIRELAAIYGV
jgi:hypothetical protein